MKRGSESFQGSGLRAQSKTGVAAGRSGVAWMNSGVLGITRAPSVMGHWERAGECGHQI